MVAYSSFTAAAPTGQAAVPVALLEIAVLEQMRLNPCGEGLRAAWTAVSQLQLL